MSDLGARAPAPGADTLPVVTGAPPRPVLPSDASPRDLMLWTVNVINAHDAEALRQAYGPDTLYRMPTATRRGADQIVDYWRALFAAVPDTTLTALALVAEGETLFMRWRLTGTHTGAAFEGIEPTGARLDIDGMDHVTIRDRRITSNVVIFDQMQFARQLGLLPADGSRVDVGLKRAFNALTRLRRRG